MSLRLNFKKVMCGVVVSTYLILIQTMVPTVYAANTSVITNDATKNENSKIAVKNSVITFEDVKGQNETLSELGMSVDNSTNVPDIPMLCISLERKGGVPKNTNCVELDAKDKKVSMTISKVKYTEDNIKGIKEVTNDAEANAKQNKHMNKKDIQIVRNFIKVFIDDLTKIILGQSFFSWD